MLAPADLKGSLITHHSYQFRDAHLRKGGGWQICNAVSISRMLNATLVLPYLLYNDGAQDLSQFGDLFEVDHFIAALAPDVRIVTEVPPVLQLLDLGALGNVVTDADIPKEALLPTFFHLLPLLRRHGAIHLFGFVNRVAADPVPFHLQVLIARRSS